jgi:hypothetical protein
VRPHAAWCIVGQARGFANLHVARSIRTNGIDAFGAVADVFLILRHSGGAEDEEAIHRSARELSPVHVHIRNDTALLGHASYGLLCNSPVGSHLERFVYAWSDVSMCFDVVLQEEARRGTRYDFAIKVRLNEQCEGCKT